MRAARSRSRSTSTDGRAASCAPGRTCKSGSPARTACSPSCGARRSTIGCASASGGSPCDNFVPDLSQGCGFGPDPSIAAGRPSGVLHELRVENLLLIERAELRLAPGLNVLTGETGAGKTVLAHALDLLLGGRARPGIVRPGAAEAYVEGVFELPDALRGELGERLPADAEEVVLARRVSAEGRTRAYVNGRSASAGDLRDLAAPLIAF